MKYTLILFLTLLGYNEVNCQSIKDDISWLIDVQDRGATPYITQTDNLGNTHLLGLYDGCQTCFISIDSIDIIEEGNGNDYLFLMKIDEFGDWDQPLLIPTNGSLTIYDFEINLNNELIVYLNSDNDFFFGSTQIKGGISIVNISSSYQLNWAKSIEGAQNSSTSLRSNDQIYSSKDHLSINSKNDIIFTGYIPRVYTDEIIDTIIWPPDTFFIYDYYLDTLVIDFEEFTADDTNFFITSLDFQGNHKWTKVYEHYNVLRVDGIAVSKDDEIAICGHFSDTDFIMESDTLSGIDTTYKSTNYCMFVSTFDIEGNQKIANRYYQNSFPGFYDL